MACPLPELIDVRMLLLELISGSSIVTYFLSAGSSLYILAQSCSARNLLPDRLPYIMYNISPGSRQGGHIKGYVPIVPKYSDVAMRPDFGTASSFAAHWTVPKQLTPSRDQHHSPRRCISANPRLVSGSLLACSLRKKSQGNFSING